MYFEDGELTMVVKTTRLSKRAIRRVQDLAILLKYLRKQQTDVTFQDALDFAISFTDENYTQVMGNMPNKDIAQSSIEEIPSQNIPHEILQTATPQQSEERPPLQTASRQQTSNAGLGGYTLEQIKIKAKEPLINLDAPHIAQSKQEEKPSNVIEMTDSKRKLQKKIISK